MFNLCILCFLPEIIRVSGAVPAHGFGDYDRLPQGSPSPMASPNLIPNTGGTGFGGWNAMQQEVNYHMPSHLHE